MLAEGSGRMCPCELCKEMQEGVSPQSRPLNPYSLEHPFPFPLEACRRVQWVAGAVGGTRSRLLALGVGELMWESKWAGWSPKESLGRSNRMLMVLQTHHICSLCGETEAELALGQGLAESVICKHA